MRRRWIRLVVLWDTGRIAGSISIVHNFSDAADVYTNVSQASYERIRRVLEESNAIRRGSYWFVDWNYIPRDDEDHPDNVERRIRENAGDAYPEPQGSSQGGYATFHEPSTINWDNTLRYEDFYRLRDRLIEGFRVPDRFWYSGDTGSFNLRYNNDE